jgi:hypothetical protein
MQDFSLLLVGMSAVSIVLILFSFIAFNVASSSVPVSGYWQPSIPQINTDAPYAYAQLMQRR